VIDSRSVKTTESGGPRGHDVGKKIVCGRPRGCEGVLGVTAPRSGAVKHDEDRSPFCRGWACGQRGRADPAHGSSAAHMTVGHTVLG
jgi:hypothetical protein